jgi:hypothetical protein
MAQITDRDILADTQAKITPASCEHECAGNRGGPDNFAINEAPNVLQEFGGYAQNNGANGGYSVQVGGDIPYLAKGVLSLDDDCAQGLIH